MLAKLVLALRDAGLLALLDLHVEVGGVWPDRGVASLGSLGEAWLRVADAFCDPATYWNVLGADLKNEPHGMYWGPLEGSSYPAEHRWDTMAGAVGSLLHQRCPRWLLFIEGVGHCRDDPAPEAGCQHPAAVAQDVGVNSWWGENLQGAASSPVRVVDAAGAAVPGKVTNSPRLAYNTRPTSFCLLQLAMADS